jgi:hypothetical protein
MCVADFILAARGETEQINRATASFQTANGFEWFRSRHATAADVTDVEICGILACAAVVGKVQEI